jgi:hypothetical protein
MAIGVPEGRLTLSERQPSPPRRILGFIEDDMSRQLAAPAAKLSAHVIYYHRVPADCRTERPYRGTSVAASDVWLPRSLPHVAKIREPREGDCA